MEFLLLGLGALMVVAGYRLRVGGFRFRRQAFSAMRILNVVLILGLGAAYLAELTMPGGIDAGFALLAVVWAGAVARLPSYWRKPDPRPAQYLAWEWGESAVRGVTRAFPTMMLGLGGLTVAAAPIGREMSLVGLLLFMGTWPVMLSIAVLNRPRLLVPPPLRREPGWWQSWRANRRRAK